MSMQDAGTEFVTDVVRVRDKLLQLENALVATRNPQAWFVALYRTTTTRCGWLVEGILREGHPRHASLRGMDPRLVRDIVVHFEPRYSKRLRAYHAGCLAESDPWYPVFHQGVNLGPFATLVLGAYTHIAFDLPMVLATTVDPGRPLYDHDDARQVTSFQRLNHWFALDIGRVAIRVTRLLPRMNFRETPALVGRCRSRHLRFWTTPLWRLLLGYSRRCAARDARLIREGKLDEPALGSAVRRNSLRLIAMFQRLSRTLETVRGCHTGMCLLLLRER